MKPVRVLTIAGSDSGGGAGIQADLKTITVLGGFGMSVITALTAQNTLGVHGIHDVPPEFVAAQFDAVAADIGIDAAKTGMLASSEVIRAVAGKIRQYGIEKLVVDPVMVAKGGAPLIREEAKKTLIAELIPLAFVLTPNIPEAEVLSGIRITTLADMKEAARIIHRMGARHVVVKGGHLSGDAVDLLYDGCEFREFRLAADRDGGYPRDRLHLFGGDRHRARLREGCRRGRGGGQALHHRSGPVRLAGGRGARTDEPPGAAVRRGRRGDRVAGLGGDRTAGRGIMEDKTSLSGINLFFLWFGAAVSVAEILTGGYLAELGAVKGFWAIILGHLAGTLLLVLAGLIGFRERLPAIMSTRISFGKQGSYLISLINILQLVGWTAIMIIEGGTAMNVISRTLWHFDHPTLMHCLIGLSRRPLGLLGGEGVQADQHPGCGAPAHPYGRDELGRLHAPLGGCGDGTAEGGLRDGV